MTNQDEKSFSSHKILLEVVLCKGKKNNFCWNSNICLANVDLFSNNCIFDYTVTTRRDCMIILVGKGI